MSRAHVPGHVSSATAADAAAGAAPGRATRSGQLGGATAADAAAGSAPGRTTRSGQLGGATAVQRVAQPDGAQSGRDAAAGSDVHATAARGIAGPSSALPHLGRIQRLFGRHDVSRVEAHIGGPAVRACHDMGAIAFATGNHVAFRDPPDLHTAAHEATHVVQQRAGVHVHAGVGAAGDRYERNADLVADAVVAGQSAEALLDDDGPQAPHVGARLGAATQAKVERGGAGHAPCPVCGDGPCECDGAAKPTAVAPQPGAPVQKLGAASAAIQLQGGNHVQARGGSAGAGAGSASPGAVQRSEVCDSAGVCQSENDGVDESRSTSAQAPGDATSAPATSASAPNSTPAAAALRPPGNCTQKQWYDLQQVVKQNCKTNMPRACAQGDSPETIADKAAHFARCIAARTTLNNTCFGGGDPGHLEELGNLTRGLARCERMRVPVPVPQPAPEEERRTSPEVDRGFMERMAAITGLSGAALIAYLVISEGSRLFPPRNLIPVP